MLDRVSVFLSIQGNVAFIHIHNSNIIKNARITIFTIIRPGVFPIYSANTQNKAVNITTPATQGIAAIIGFILKYQYTATNIAHRNNVLHQLASGNNF